VAIVARVVVDEDARRPEGPEPRESRAQRLDVF
jgi:hypothetical protein